MLFQVLLKYSVNYFLAYWFGSYDQMPLEQFSPQCKKHCENLLTFIVPDMSGTQ